MKDLNVFVYLVAIILVITTVLNVLVPMPATDSTGDSDDESIFVYSVGKDRELPEQPYAKLYNIDRQTLYIENHAPENQQMKYYPDYKYVMRENGMGSVVGC